MSHEALWVIHLTCIVINSLAPTPDESQQCSAFVFVSQLPSSTPPSFESHLIKTHLDWIQAARLVLPSPRKEGPCSAAFFSRPPLPGRNCRLRPHQVIHKGGSHLHRPLPRVVEEQQERDAGLRALPWVLLGWDMMHVPCAVRQRGQTICTAIILDTKDTNSLDSTSAPTNAVALPQPQANNKCASTTPPVEATERKIRCACPRSPNIWGKFDVALTSPDLVVLDRSLPNAASTNTSIVPPLISSSADSSTAARRKANRRSSSRPTLSSSSNILLTERNPPSPALCASNSEEDDLDDAEPTDVCLPPASTLDSLQLDCERSRQF